MCHIITHKTLNTQYTAVRWKWAGVIYSEAFRLMTAMTDGLGLLMEVTIGYKKLNNCCKSCNWHVIFWCVLKLTNFKLCTFYLRMFLKSLTVTEWGWLTARLFFGKDCLQLLLMQAAQNTGWAEVIKREMLTDISYIWKLLYPTPFYVDPHFSEHSACGKFCPQFPQRPLPCTLSTYFSSSMAGTRTNGCMSMRLKCRHVWFR